MMSTTPESPRNRSFVEDARSGSREVNERRGPHALGSQTLGYACGMKAVVPVVVACLACSKGESKEKPAAVPAKPAEVGDPAARQTLRGSIEEAYRRAGFAAKFEVREHTLVISKLQLDGEDSCRGDTVAALLAPTKPNHRLALEAPAIDAKALESAGFNRVECADDAGRAHGEDLPVSLDRVPSPMREGAIRDQPSREIAFRFEPTLDETLPPSTPDVATQVMVALLSHCKQATDVAADPLDDVWNTVRRVTTGQIEVPDVSARPVWNIVVEFDDRRRSVHTGMPLSFQIDERRERVRPADQLAGELCKLRSGRWTKLE